MRRVKRVLAAVFTSALMLAAVSSPALAINDALVPGDNCAAPNAEAVGHPAVGKPPFPPPFSLNNPGNSPGAQGSANTQAPCAA